MGFVLASKFPYCYFVKHKARTEPQFKHLHELTTPLTKQYKTSLKHILRIECHPDVRWIYSSKLPSSENLNLYLDETI